MAFAGYITVAFIAARLAAPSVGVINASASLNGVATLNAQPAVQRSASLTGIANLTSVASVIIPGSASITGIANLAALRSTQLQSSIVGIGSLSSTGTVVSPTLLLSNIIGNANLTAGLSFVRTASISGTANIFAVAISPTTPAIPLFANIIGIANFVANGTQPDLCECPDYTQPPTLVNGFTRQNNTTCLSYTRSATLTLVNGFTRQNDTTCLPYTKSATLTNAWQRKGCG
jgi:hypothetical protein